MEAVPEVTPPPAFCSIQAKFDFLEKVHKPAYAAAIRNNDAARGYLATLNQLAQDYDSHSTPAAVLACDRFRTFEPKAREAYDLAGVLLQLDQKIRDAPLEHCSGGKAG